MLVGLAVLAIYLGCIAPGVFWRDSGEFCFLGHQLDIGHPAGSPFFSMVTKAFTLVPLGSLAWRVNWFDVLAATAAVLLLWLATARWAVALGVASPALALAFGACAALSFAFSASFWAWSEVAEVYAAQAALLALLLWLAAESLIRQFDARVIGTLGFVLGLSCGMHMVQILYAPGFALALLFTPPWRVRWRALMLMILFFFVGFAVYAYLPVRSMAGLTYDYGHPQTWPNFVAQITGRKYAGIIHHFPWSAIFYNLYVLLGHIVEELNPLLALAAVVGLIALARRRARGLSLFVLVLLGHLYLYVKDWSKAFGYIPVFLLCAWAGAIGLASIWSLVSVRLTRRPERSAVAWVAALALVMGIWGFSRHVNECNLSTHDLTYRHGRAALSSMPTNAILVGYQDPLAYNAFYQQLIERWRPDVSFIHRAWLPYPDELHRRFPALQLADYRPDQPFSVHHMLSRNGGNAGAFWDYGWETEPAIDSTRMIPHGIVYRLTEEAWNGEPVAEDERLWRDMFWPIVLSPLVAPRGYDWTAQEIYARMFHVRAKVQADAGRWAFAAHEEETAIRLRPDFAENHAFLGLALLAQKNTAAGKDEIARSLLLNPLCALCRDAAGQMQLMLGDRQAALEEYREAYRLDDANGDYAIRLTKLLLEARSWSEAERTAESALPGAQDVSQKTTLHLYAARAAIGRGQCQAARPHLLAVQRMNPASPLLRPLLEACGFGPGGDL